MYLQFRGSFAMPSLLVNQPPPTRLEVCFHLSPTSDPEYVDGDDLLVPSGPWTAVSAHENSGRVAEAWAPYDRGGALKDNLALVNLRSLVDTSGPTLRTDVDRVLRSLSSDPDSIVHNGKGCVVGVGRARYTTKHQILKKLVGLHLDSWDAKGVIHLRTARNRFCMNLGPHPRWFLYSAFEVMEAAAFCHIPDTARIGSCHLRKYALHHELPVFRILIEPGEAYIAPTERVLHDGQATNDESTWLYTAMGHFDQTQKARELAVE
jgi:hypothetical protein